MIERPNESDDTLDNLSGTPKEFDQRIYAGLMQGDQEVWTEFYDYYSEPLDRYFRKKNVYNEQDREDLFIETMEAIVQSLDRYDPDRVPLRNWIYGIAKNIMLKNQKRYSQRYDHEESGDDALEQAAFHRRDGFEEDSIGEVDPHKALLRKALPLLSEPKQKILKMYASRTTTWAELAQELDTGISAAKMRYQRALDELKQIIETLDTGQD